jgi:hypothetical protein
MREATPLPKGVKDLAEQAFGKLTAKFIVEFKTGCGAIWRCACACGEERDVLAHDLRRGGVTCCERCADQVRAARLRLGPARAAQLRLVRPAEDADEPGAYEHDWRYHLAGMDGARRAFYDTMIAKRRRLGIPITDDIRSSAVEVAMREDVAA